MASKGRLLRQIGAFARRMTAGDTTKTLQLAQAQPTLPIMQQKREQIWRMGVGFAAAAAAASAFAPTAAQCTSTTDAPSTVPDLSSAGISLKGSKTPGTKQRSIVFVLGGPGSGKGTQCAKLVKEFGVVHLSAGDLLRAHMKSGTPDGNMVAEMIKEGKIVPSHVTNGLLEGAMNAEQDASGKNKFLIDGFPRNDENRAAFEADTGEQPTFILFFNCPEEVMEKRLLGRNEGRTDDNAETIRKRFKVFIESSLPVIEHYRGLGKVREIAADRSPDEVYAEVRKLFVDM
mmetsp:Transcript_5096/g.14628  ORF Transcript_5096/g.14628 Transcript_5096/m.14628 type:complete len:288 (+) Transcript_5096:135-998(+)|eukprot:CAMPEP_0206139702 /NCGR_PEP_ID=MMETSP1473-20131121/7019_1 /ASSEMBLY_ACC=CAM_ASM_001109 /TAXON_ID=1461547 /ORGANISM="Stichococcus sp, Strain RCC1054" /LENGTH=287 /DNA_ID=CAMNT_0053533591 /DNA_START=115 /DNA_END=978 /DNA_ORIENTATION=-